MEEYLITFRLIQFEFICFYGVWIKLHSIYLLAWLLTVSRTDIGVPKVGGPQLAAAPCPIDGERCAVSRLPSSLLVVCAVRDEECFGSTLAPAAGIPTGDVFVKDGTGRLEDVVALIFRPLISWLVFGDILADSLMNESGFLVDHFSFNGDTFFGRWVLALAGIGRTSLLIPVIFLAGTGLISLPVSNLFTRKMFKN